MEINRNNYEIYFLDYQEGNLSAQQQAELFLFLRQHPDLKNEFESFDMVKLPAINISFEEKNSLKRELITRENYQQYLIANLEGDLNKEEKHELNKFLFQHPEFKKEEKIFAYTKFSPDDSVVFPDKSKLKHAVPISEGKKKAFYFSIAAAACILLIMGVYFFRQNTHEVLRANNETKKEISPIAKNSNSVDNKNQVENVNLLVKKNQPLENTLSENKNVFANNINVEQKEKKLHEKKNHEEKTTAEKKINISESNELIVPIERKEIAQIETKENLQQQIAFVNIGLFKQEINNTTAWNSYLDRVTDPDSKNNSSDIPVSISQNKQRQKPFLNLFAWALSAFSKKDVTVKKSFNADGEMVAYQLESGKFKIGKSSSR